MLLGSRAVRAVSVARQGPVTGTVGSSARPQPPRLSQGVRVESCHEVKLA